MPGAHLVSSGDDAVHHRQTGHAQRVLGPGLVHRQGGCQHAGMGIGQVQPFQDALDTTVFPEPAMQGVENDIAA